MAPKAMTLAWQRTLAHLVNTVSISKTGKTVAAGTYLFPYKGTNKKHSDGTFGTYCFDAAGNEVWKDEFTGNEGVYTVAVSGNGKVVASGGLLTGGIKASDKKTPTVGLLRAYSATTGKVQLDYSSFASRVNSVSLSDDGAVLAAVTLDGKLLVFAKKKGAFPAEPQTPVTQKLRLDMVVVHPSGKYLVACGWGGNAYLVTLTNGKCKAFKWKAPTSSLKLLACAVSRTKDTIVVGGRRKVFLFDKKSMMAKPKAKSLDQITLPDGKTTEDLRWLALSGDGSLVTAVTNVGFDVTGLLLRYSNTKGKLAALGAPIALNHNPNSTSINTAGTVITAADGHPVGAPGTFYLFDAKTGAKLMEFGTDDMNWPMVVSANGKAAAGGSDNAHLYYFK